MYFFWTVWKARNKIAFEDDVLSIQSLKSSFVYFLWSETKLFIKDGLLTLVDFIDWVGSCWGWGSFCTSVLGNRFVPAGEQGMFLLCILWAPVLAAFSIQFFSFTYPKKKKSEAFSLNKESGNGRTQARWEIKESRIKWYSIWSSRKLKGTSMI